MEDLTNRVAQGEIEVYNLQDLWDEGEVVELDVVPFLVEGLMLKEEVFRKEVNTHDFTAYEDKHVAIFCSTDAIVPTWAYMLLASKLKGTARSVAFGNRDDLLRDYFTRALKEEDWSRYEGKPVVVKGCGGDLVPTSAYLVATQRLQEVARKLMFGEPCSSVPLWRRPRKKKPARATGVKKPSADLPSPGASA